MHEVLLHNFLKFIVVVFLKLILNGLAWESCKSYRRQKCLLHVVVMGV